MYQLKQSSTAKPLCFLMIDEADHLSPITGLTPTVTISKNGASFASPAGAVTELANGWYKVAGNATDTNTLGVLILHATATGADPTDVIYQVVAYDPDSATNLGLSDISDIDDAVETIQSQTSQIPITQSQTGATAVGTDYMTFNIVRGDDYTTPPDTIDFTSGNWGIDITGATLVMTIKNVGGSTLLTHAGSVVSSGGTSQTVRFTPDHDDTDIALGTHFYDVEATISGVVRTLVRGTVTVLEDYTTGV